MMGEHTYEIAMDVEQAYEDGTYFQLASKDAEREVAHLGVVLASVLEFTDEDVDAVLAFTPEAAAVDAETLASEVRRAVRSSPEASA